MVRQLLIILVLALSGLAAASVAMAQESPLVPEQGRTLDLLIQGSELHYQGRLDEAATVLEQAITVEPDNVFALNQLGLVLAKLGEHDQAESLFRQGISLDETNVFAMTWLAILALGRDDVEGAREMLDRVFAFDPDNAEGLYLDGVIRSAEGDVRAALESFRRAQQADSQDPDAHYRLATAFLDLDMELNARLEYERTLALEPGHVRAMNSLGWLYYNSGYVQEALALWRRALEHGDTEARSNLAKAYLDSVREALDAGDEAEARRLCLMMESLDPGNKAARFYLQTLDGN